MPLATRMTIEPPSNALREHDMRVKRRKFPID